ncbi:MAG TPA: SDR family NAD(P)-dependent oxidoreductase [Limnochordia bacterium]|nr:SDR family NAD(P)-dependent oxidoreductase [Limnochordia bacterium]
MEIDLRGKVAIVTGAGRGIGREIASTLAREGVRTVVTDIDPALLDDVAQQFSKEGWEGRSIRCDVRSKAEVQKAVAETVERYGRIDILVNNAGVAPGGLVETLDEEVWDLNLAVNVKGTFLMCQAVVPVMKRQRWGRILNAASFAAIIPTIGGAAYAASKAAVVSFTRVLAGELGPWNITVNCYAPGMIPTQINRFAEAPPEAQERLLDTLTLRRWGEPRDVANLICFLASDLAGYITGTLIDISGGKFATQNPKLAYQGGPTPGRYGY